MSKLSKFADICNNLSPEEIYILFEDLISDELRDKILAQADIDSLEPVREALNLLGRRHGIRSLEEF